MSGPPAAAEPGDRPVASPLARAQVRAGHEHVVSLRHQGIGVQHGAIREMLPLLDGTRDRDDLAAFLVSAELVPAGKDPAALVDSCLTAICRSGLLVPDGPTDAAGGLSMSTLSEPIAPTATAAAPTRLCSRRTRAAWPRSRPSAAPSRRR